MLQLIESYDLNHRSVKPQIPGQLYDVMGFGFCHLEMDMLGWLAPI